VLNPVLPPILNIKVLLLVEPATPQHALVLTQGEDRIRIDPTPRCVLLESWRVQLTRTPSSATASPTSPPTPSVHDVKIQNVYKQAIALFRSMYSLLRILPTGNLRRRLRRGARRGLAGGLSLDVKAEIIPQNATGNFTTESSTGGNERNTIEFGTCFNIFASSLA
jgi:hypothetical protein